MPDQKTSSQPAAPANLPLLPVTILTGFLGAGKTTLLNRILRDDHGHRIAVIENEFGPENIDGTILVRDNAEQIVEMSNGCICCTVRGDLIAALVSLAQRRDEGEIGFDRVVIESTGLADPGPIAQTFLMDETVARRYLLDAIVTVVDALHGMHQLDQHEEARRQVGFADRLLLSKTDLATPDDLAALTARLGRMNPRAPQVHADFGQVPLSDIFDLRGFNLNDKFEIDPAAIAQNVSPPPHAPSCPCCSHIRFPRDPSRHLDDIAAFAFSSVRAFDSGLLEEFLGAMVQVYGPQMLRYKGVLSIAGLDRKLVFQGVHQLMGSDLGELWADGDTRRSRMVFIGKNLPQAVFLQGLEQCLL